MSLAEGQHFSRVGGQYPPHGVITEDDIGAYAIVATWIGVSISVLAVLVRVAMRTPSFSGIGRDNILIVLALITGIAQSAAAHVAVQHGLGRREDSLNEADFNAYGRAIYASQILSLATYSLCKLSLIAVFRIITPSPRLRIAFWILTAFVSLWTVAAFFALAFQCGVPSPWLRYGETCRSQEGLFYANGVINIVTDALLVLFPVFIMWNVKVKPRTRLVVMAMFWARAAVCVTASIQLSVIEPYFEEVDTTWNNLLPTLWTQITVHLSIITACIPFLKPFFDKLQSSLVDPSMGYNLSNPFSIELRQMRSSKGSSSKKSSSTKQALSTLRGTNFIPKTENTVEGGPGGNESTEQLAENWIRETREVGISVAPKSPARTNSEGGADLHGAGFQSKDERRSM